MASTRSRSRLVAATGSCVAPDPQELAQHPAERLVGTRRFVHRAASDQNRHTVDVGDQLFDEPGLAHARLADELYDAAAASDRGLESVRAGPPSPARGRPAADASCSASRRRPAVPRLWAFTGCALPFTVNGGSSCASKDVRERVEHGVGHEDLPFGGPTHEAGREVHGVAPDRVGPSIRWSEIGRRTRLPEFTPIRSGRAPARSMMLRRASNIPSSSLPELDGAPQQEDLDAVRR